MKWFPLKRVAFVKSFEGSIIDPLIKCFFKTLKRAAVSMVSGTQFSTGARLLYEVIRSWVSMIPVRFFTKAITSMFL